GISAGDTLCVGRKHRKAAVPSRWKLAFLHQLNFDCEVWILSAVRLKKLHPLLSGFGATFADSGSKVVVHAVGDKKLCIFRKSVGPLAEPNFIFAQRFAVSGCCVLLVRRTVSDMTVEDDECGAAFRFAKDLEHLLNAIDVVGIANSQDVPSIRNESCVDVFGERDSRVAFDRDVVVVVNPAQVVEPEMSGE